MDMKAICFLSLLLSFFLILLTVDAPVAAEQLPLDLTQLDIDELMEIKIETIYAASKYEQKVTKAPSSVSIITADEIKKYGYRNFAEILRSIRGFQTTNDRNYQYLNVRGFGLPGDYNSRILLLVDGNRINDNIYDQALVGEFPLDIDLIDRIEVVRGPGSSLYGTNAFFAVINVVTKHGSDFKGLELSAEAGSLDTYKTRLSYGKTFEKGPELLLSGSYYDSQGNQRLFFEEFDSPSTNNGIAKNLDYERYKNLFAELTIEDFVFQSGYHYRKKGVPTASYETLFNHYDLFTVDKRFWAGLKYGHTYADNLSVLAQVVYNYYHYYGDYPFEGDPSIGEAEIVVNKDSAKGAWINSELQLIKTFLNQHKITFGAYYQHNLKQDQKTYYVGSVNWGELDDRRDSAVWALYLQDEFAMTEKLTLNAGLRYDYYDTFGKTINPRAALIYNPSDKTIFKLLYGQAFRAPNAYEFYYHDGWNSQKPSPNLSPEIINTYEAIYEQYMGKNLRGTIVGFYYTINDLIALQSDPADNLLVFRNIEEVESMGVEFEVEGKWKSGLEGRISYTVQKTENKQISEVLPNSAKQLAKFNVIAPLVKDKIFMAIEEQYTSKRKNISGTYTDSFYITNLTFFSKDVLKTLNVSASIYNLFDRTYSDPASEEHIQEAIEQDGRAYRLKITYRF